MQCYKSNETFLVSLSNTLLGIEPLPTLYSVTPSSFILMPPNTITYYTISILILVFPDFIAISIAWRARSFGTLINISSS